MLPKKNRLVKKQDFERVKKEGTLFQSKNFGFLVFDRKDEMPSRFGIIVSTKVDKRATKRNWARRVAKEAIRGNIEKIKKGKDVIVLMKPEIINTQAVEVNREITKILALTGMLSQREVPSGTSQGS